jgi:hypothetical protein
MIESRSALPIRTGWPVPAAISMTALGWVTGALVARGRTLLKP